jgi:hypothetical protein
MNVGRDGMRGRGESISRGKGILTSSTNIKIGIR